MSRITKKSSSVVFAVGDEFPGGAEVLEHDVPLLDDGGALQLGVGHVVPVPEVEPSEAGVEPVEMRKGNS